MASQKKVIWHEGLFLEPHHFQQQERYLEYYADARARSRAAFAWGFDRLELDAAALDRGQIALVRARGVFPDGTPFEFPGAARTPPALDVPRDARDTRVVLAIPQQRAGHPEVDPFGDESSLGELRCVPRTDRLSDATSSSASEVEAQMAELVPRLLVAPREDTGSAPGAPKGFVALGVTQVVERSAANRVTLDDDYIWPALSCADQPVLAGYVREICGMLGQRGEAIASALGQPGPGGVGSYSDFLELNAINRYSPLFEHFARHPLLHPERLYSICLQAAGEFSTFTESRRPPDFPQYDHDDLKKCFLVAIGVLRNSFRRTIQPNAVRIPLQDRQYGVRLAVVNDRDLFKQADFVIAATAQVAGDMLRASFPKQVTVAPAELLVDHVRGHVPGIGLRALPVVPRQIPFHAGANYFQLDGESPLFAKLANSGGLAIHVPDVFPGLNMECWAILR